MRKFLIKTVAIVAPLVFINLILGVLRFQAGDPSIPFQINWSKQYMTMAQRNSVSGKIRIDSIEFDMSHEVKKCHYFRYKDQFGFQNAKEERNPEILFLGDSFFNDPFLGYQDGLSACFPKSLNLSFVECSGFKVFNELKKAGYFQTLPKYIVLEVVERNLDLWSDLWQQIEHQEEKTTPYRYYGLDLLFGNNLSGANWENMGIKEKDPSQKPVFPFKMDGNRRVYFYKDKLQELDSAKQELILKNMLQVQRYFANCNCRIMFLIAPDKESVFPEFYGHSHLPEFQRLMRKRGVSFVDVYQDIIQSKNRKFSYYEGDTHWNKEAYTWVKKAIKREIESQN